MTILSALMNKKTKKSTKKKKNKKKRGACSINQCINYGNVSHTHQCINQCNMSHPHSGNRFYSTHVTVKISQILEPTRENKILLPTCNGKNPHRGV